MYTSGCYGPSWPASIGWRGQCGTPMTISSDANRILLLFFHVIIITIAVMIIIFIIQLTSFNNARRCQLKTKTLSKYVTIGQIKTGTQSLLCAQHSFVTKFVALIGIITF